LFGYSRVTWLSAVLASASASPASSVMDIGL